MLFLTATTQYGGFLASTRLRISPQDVAAAVALETRTTVGHLELGVRHALLVPLGAE